MDILLAAMNEGSLVSPGQGEGAKPTPQLLEFYERLEATLDLPLEEHVRTQLTSIRAYLRMLAKVGAGSPPMSEAAQMEAIKTLLEFVTNKAMNMLGWLPPVGVSSAGSDPKNEKMVTPADVDK
jgi:hypothetical protein